MGGFSFWHWLFVLLMVGLPVLAVAIIVRAGRRSQSSGSANRQSTAARLAELGALRDKGLISEEEFQRKRAGIIGGI